MQPQKEVVQGDATNESLPPSCGHPRRLDLTSSDSVLPRPDRPSDRKSARPEDPTLVAFSVEKRTLLSAPQHHGVQKTLKKKKKKEVLFLHKLYGTGLPGLFGQGSAVDGASGLFLCDVKLRRR